jgi:cell shape-determining protein MreC
VVLNRGKHDRMQAGYFALCDNAIVGRIYRVDPFDSRLMLVTHPQSSVRAYITHMRSNGETPPRILGKLDGLGSGVMRMRVNSQEDIRPGDPVHAMIQEHLDVPFRIGTVVSCDTDRDEPTLTEAIVEPAAPLHALRELHVIVPKELN